MIHTVQIDDSTENGKLVLELLKGFGIVSGSEVNPLLKEVLLKSLEESKNGNLKSHDEVFSEIKQWLHSV